MSLLFYTIGYPGAGKTSFARNLSRWFAGSHLQADQVGRALFVVPTFSPAERIAVYQHMDYQAMAGLNKGTVICYDGTINSLEQRHHLRQLAAQYDTKAVGLWLQLPIEVAKDRAGKVRDAGGGLGGRVVPPEVFDRHVQSFETPGDDEPIAAIDGQVHFSEQYRQLRSQLHHAGIADLPRLIQL